jgi:uncharacterized protein YbbC (DUF1343 family)
MIRTGLEVLLGERPHLLRGRRVGLVSHPAAVLPNLTGAADALLQAGVRLTALYAPEHGLAGTAAEGASVAHASDTRRGLPVWSLYGSAKQPDAEMLADVDALIFDMQDVGARFYTYISTLWYVLRGAASVGKPVIVLDRPNPITGALIEGPLIDPGCESFVGIAPLPIRHGLTIAEIALYMNEGCGIGAELTVIEMRGWRRSLWFDQTGLVWVPTSPAMPHLSTATLYPGMCLLEGTNLSLGRGTALPFELCGAPWIDEHALAELMNSLELPGVRFRATRFVPAASQFAGQECGGVQVHVVDRAATRPVALGLQLVATVRSLYPQAFAWYGDHFDRLIGNRHTRPALDAVIPAETVVREWQAARASFEALRRPFLRYE